jgi:uncharacterized protein (DUF427 family)
MSVFAKRPKPDPIGPGEESVWEYPRPPRLEAEGRQIILVFNGVTVVDTKRALRVLETSHPPTYYLPPDDFAPGSLVAAPGASYCEWKGIARYPSPTPSYAALADHVAVYCSTMDSCTVGGEAALPQPGGFYGGWVNSWIKGPFKGDPQTLGW